MKLKLNAICYLIIFNPISNPKCRMVVLYGDTMDSYGDQARVWAGDMGWSEETTDNIMRLNKDGCFLKVIM